MRLENPAAKAAAISAVIGICGCLLYLVLCDFLVGALTDQTIAVTADAPLASFITDPFTGGGANPAVLEAAVRYVTNSPRLHLKLAEFERDRPDSDDVSAAESHATRAIRLSPHDYRPRLLLASIEELKGDAAATEDSARAVLQLAPRNVEAHYILGALLLTRGSLDESFEEFRTAISGYPEYFRPALNLVWSETHENAGAVRAITPDKPKDRLALARFLLERSRPLESAAIFRQIDRGALLGDRESAQYLNSLIAAGQVTLAYELWRGLLGDDDPSPSPGAIWNGGFESDILVDFAQFDWSIQPGKYATVSIDTGIAHTGKRSLRIDFLGHETTRLEDEIKQVLLLRPGARYQVHYHVRTDNLTVPEGPRVAVTGRGSNQWIAASDPAPEGSHDWQEGTLEFTASGGTVLLAIKQRPKFSYERPTRGTVWFDDFEIREIQ